METKSTFWEKWFSGIVLFLFLKTLPFSFFLQDFDLLDPSDETKSILRIFWFIADTIVLALVLYRWKSVAWLSARNPLLIVLMVFIVASTMWSISPSDTLRRSVAFIISTVFGIYLAERFSTVDILRLLAWVLGITMVSCWIVALLIPEMGIMTSKDSDAWKGTFSHKNPMGVAMLVTCTVLFFVPKLSSRLRWTLWLGMLLSFLLVLLSDSKAALLLGLLQVPVYVFLHYFRGNSRFSVPFGVLSIFWFCFVGILVLYNLEFLMGRIGRDFTLTGRDVIWTEIWEMIQVNFWLGYGYKAFWLAKGGPAEEVWESAKWVFMEAHNGYLESWLGLGIIGLLLVLLISCLTVVRTIQQYRESEYESGIWQVLFLLMYLQINIIESYYLNEHNLYWVLFVFIVASSNRKQKVSNLQFPNE